MRADSDSDADTVGLGRQGAPLNADTELPRGSAIDRYVILEPVGKGGMGHVYSAYDPQLDRRVALKLLRAPPRAENAQTKENEWRARLMREAQAMARLSHPNVVTVYDVGMTEAGRVFLAMEIVEGGTAVTWLKDQKRSWREIVDLFCDAGEGLAAAHRAGMIHRDFKPDNILIGTDGRPRVTDFGLARAAVNEPSGARERSPPSLPPEHTPPSLEKLSSVSLSSPLTLTGTLLGTPGYMAPEQYGTDEDIDVRADVFAFCATLYKALYGERAFAGETVEQIAMSTLNGRVRPVPKGSEVPPWIRRVLLHGLAPQRQARPGSMQEVLTALRADPAKRRRRWIAAGAAVAAVCGAVVAVQGAEKRHVRGCRAMADRLGGVWDGPRKDAIAAAFAATHLDYAADNLTKVRRALDGYAASWARTTEEACTATRVRGEQSEAMLDLQTACLDDRLDELRALGEVLTTADAKVVERSVQAVRGLSPMEPCADRDRLSATTRLPGDPVARAQIRALQGEVAAAKELYESGRSLESLERLQRVHDRVEGSHYGPLLVAWTMNSAYARSLAGDTKAAALDFEQAASLADTYRLDTQRAEALIELGDLSEAFVHYDESHRWMRLASATIARTGGDARLEVHRDVLEGWTYAHEHKRTLAQPLFERALARAEEAHLDAPEFVAYAHSGLADVLTAQGRFDEAIDQMRVCIRTLEDANGAQHPRVANELSNLAAAQLDAGRVDDALATASRAVGIFEAAVQRGDIAARSAYEGTAVQTMGEALLRLRRAREAAERLERAHDIYRAAGEQEDSVALADNELADALRLLGRAGEARAALNEASDIEHKVSGVPAETVAGTLAVRAKLAFDQPKAAAAAAALPMAERALSLLEGGEPHLYELADARLLLARVLKARTRERGRALTLAEQARDAFARLRDQRLTDEASELANQLQ
jgi:tetratricopeptide (TPR) repeat protein/tRNA A-37 threonylcarbamoyl transferase component Bud32